MPANFVHLRLHSAYSLAESTLRIESLSRLIADDNQPAAAITDTNNMFGALEFAQTLIGVGIQPIMGTQLNLEDTQGQGEIVLLAQTDFGYINLSKLLSKTLLEADAVHDSSCSLDDLEAHAEGLILLSGGALAGFLGAPAGDGRPALRQHAQSGLRQFLVIGFILNYSVTALALNARLSRIFWKLPID